MLIVGILAGCSADAALPDRDDSAVQAEERRIAALMESATWIEGASCEARVLRQEGEVSWAWVLCAGESNGIDQGESAPVRVDGNQVRQPATATYAEDVKTLFPADLAAAVLTSEEDLKP